VLPLRGNNKLLTYFFKVIQKIILALKDKTKNKRRLQKLVAVGNFVKSP
jgi:hypothetical protein